MKHTSVPGEVKAIVWVDRIAASAADCKSVDFGHRWFESTRKRYV